MNDIVVIILVCILGIAALSAVWYARLNWYAVGVCDAIGFSVKEVNYFDKTFACENSVYGERDFLFTKYVTIW